METGRMGRPMAGHLLAARHALVAHDHRKEAAASPLARGAAQAESAADGAHRAATVTTIVPTSREMEALVSTMLLHLEREHLLTNMTSADPSSTRRLAKEVETLGARMIDAPVSGGAGGAEPATLSIMVGGISTGHAMKLINNVLSAACLTVTAKASPQEA